MEKMDLDFPWALFQLAQTIYAISTQHIKAMVIMEDINIMPGMPKYTKGLLNLRGEIIPVIDLRKFYGMRSINEEILELQDLLEQRKTDHINWINTLEDSVKEQKEFVLTTDPHVCAFGKWRDSYQTADNMLNYLLRKFDEPHQKIHAAAIAVKEFERMGEYPKAYELIAQIRNTEYRIMLGLFATFIDQYRESRREIVIIIEEGNRQLGLAVDSVLAIEPILKDTTLTLPGSGGKKSTRFQIGKRSKDDTPIILIDERSFADC
jgi:chemotaxis signal transduction protein